MHIALKAGQASLERTGWQVMNAFEIPRPMQQIAIDLPAPDTHTAQTQTFLQRAGL